MLDYTHDYKYNKNMGIGKETAPTRTESRISLQVTTHSEQRNKVAVGLTTGELETRHRLQPPDERQAR